jgi:spore maturation protein A
MEVLKRSGLLKSLTGLLRPVLGRLFPRASRDAETMGVLSANVAANLLGLGNAATPMGIKAASGMARLSRDGRASDELCLLVVVNTASIQLLPTTVAAVRAANGAAAPFDILPAVWITSAVSVAVGILAAKLLSALYRRWKR